MDKDMSINVKNNQRVTCIKSVRMQTDVKEENGKNAFTKGRQYISIEDGQLLDNFLSRHGVHGDTKWFNEHFTLNTFTPVAQQKRYHLSYEFLGEKMEQHFDTLFEYAQALDRIMDLAEVPQSTIDFKTETI